MPTFEKIRDMLHRTFKREKRPGAPTSLTAGNEAIDPRNSWTPDLEKAPPEEVSSFVMMLHDSWMQARAPYEPIWCTDYAFWLGNQWSTWDPATARLKSKPAPSWRRRLTINRILPTISTLKGKVNRSVHQANTVPMDETPTGYADARIGGRVLKAEYQLLEIPEVLDEAIDWQLIVGNGFVFIGWDPTLGEWVETPDGQRVKQGDLDLEAFSPFEALAPSDCPGFRRPTRFMQVRLVDIEVARAQFGDAARNLVPDSEVQAQGQSTTWGTRLLSLLTGNLQGSNANEAANSCYLCKLWEDPEVMNEDDAQRYPNGRETIISRTQQIVLSQQENPYESPLPSQSKIPVAHFKDHSKPGEFWAMSRIDQLVGIQENYNKGRSDMVEARDLTCRPIAKIQQGHGITAFVARPGAVFEYMPGSNGPEFMEPPKMSDYHIRDVVELTPRDFQDISQVPEVQRGEAPFSQMPASAIDMLQEAADTPLAGLAKNMARALTRVNTFILARVRQFFDEPRVLSYVGDDNEEDTFLFMRDRHPTRIHAIVTAESVFPESRASRRANVRQDVEAGILDPIKHRSTILQYLEYGNEDALWENDDLDRQNAWRENRKMAEGEEVEVQPFDNSQIHLYHHRRYQKTPEYRGLPPDAQQRIEMHVQKTIAMLAEEAGAGAEAVPDAGPPGSTPPQGPPPMPGEGGPPTLPGGM